MPEQITKYPEVTLEVLRGAGARCGIGVEQRILKKCPRDRFCALPTGEICVYGIKDIPEMTQISTRELAHVVCPPKDKSSAMSPVISRTDAALLAGVLAVGLVVGRFSGRWVASYGAERPSGGGAG
jgi:hypothetical protein